MAYLLQTVSHGIVVQDTLVNRFLSAKHASKMCWLMIAQMRECSEYSISIVMLLQLKLSLLVQFTALRILQVFRPQKRDYLDKDTHRELQDPYLIGRYLLMLDY